MISGCVRFYDTVKDSNILVDQKCYNNVNITVKKENKYVQTHITLSVLRYVYYSLFLLLYI